MKKIIFIRFALLISVICIGTVLVSCKTKEKKREIVRLEYPNNRYILLYKDDMTVAEPIKIFGQTEEYSLFNFDSSDRRPGWDQSQTGVLSPKKQVIMPPFYTGFTIVWDPVTKERFFFGSWLSGVIRHVYDMSGKKIAEMSSGKWLELEKLNISKNPFPLPRIDSWEIKNFKSKL